tara:strand:- start:1535 stop:2572 length:1038 start_codon:yes stop_codon:yes gene_type:complete
MPKETTQSDVNEGLSENEMLDALAGDFFEKEEDLPEQEVDDTEEAEEESDDAESEETEELEGDEQEEDAEESKDDGEDLPEGDSEEDTELDLDYLIPVKIDGEESEVSMKELIRGYQTAAHANKKSIDASEQLKIAQALAQESTALKEENAKLLSTTVDAEQRQLAAYDRKIQQLIADDDMYELPKWQEARRVKAREIDETKSKAFQLDQESKQEQQTTYDANLQAYKEQAVEQLNSKIPGWEKSYDEVVNWAVRDLGLPDFAEVVDPDVIALMYDYKILKDGKKSAVTKRKRAPVKSVKANKSVNKNAKAKEKAESLRKKVLKGEATENQQEDFLGSMAADLLT